MFYAFAFWIVVLIAFILGGVGTWRKEGPYWYGAGLCLWICVLILGFKAFGEVLKQ